MIATKKLSYTALEVAELLGVCRMHVYNEISEGNIPAKKLGAKILIPAEWVERFGRIEGPDDD